MSFGAAGDVKTCTFGDKSSTVQLVLYGDSHAAQWFDPLLRMSAAHGWKLTTALKSGCPAMDIMTPATGSGFANACARWRTAAIERIVSLHPDIVFIGNASSYVRRENQEVKRPGGVPR